MKSKTFRFFVCGLALASLPLAGCGKTSSSGSASVSGSNTGTSDSASASTSSGSSEEPAPTAGTTAYGAYEVSYNAKKDGVIVSKDTLLSRANLTGSETLSKTRFFDLLYYAYHDAMPNHQGQRLYTAAPAIPASFYGHVPTNAVLAYEWLNGRGLYTPEKDSSGADITSFNGSKAVTDAFMKTYFKRIHSYYGISQLDDFATSVDYDYYFEDTSRVAGTSNSLTYDTQIVSNANIAQWFQIHLLTMATGTHRDNIFNFYNSYNDDSVKVKGNLGGFYTKFKEIADASTVSSFLTLDESLFATQGFDPLFKTFEGDSVHDDVKTVLCCIDPYTSTYSSTDYAAGTEKYATDLATKEYIFENLGFENAAFEAGSYFFGKRVWFPVYFDFFPSPLHAMPLKNDVVLPEHRRLLKGCLIGVGADRSRAYRHGDPLEELAYGVIVPRLNQRNGLVIDETAQNSYVHIFPYAHG